MGSNSDPKRKLKKAQTIFGWVALYVNAGLLVWQIVSVFFG